MRIHTNATRAAICDIDVPGVFAYSTEHGSRTHDRALEVQLNGTGYARNTGTRGADTSGLKTATWDEWGIWLAALYRLDPSARAGGTAARPVYADADDFHEATGQRFNSLFDPAKQHRRHRWEWQNDGSSECKCGAARWPLNTPDAHASLAR